MNKFVALRQTLSAHSKLEKFLIAVAGLLLTGVTNLVQAETLYATSDNRNLIYKITSDGVSSVFTHTDSGPAGLAFDRAGNLYVANHFANTIQKFDSNGVGSVFASGDGLNGPTDLAFDSAGNLYVTNIGSNGEWSVYRFDRTGTPTLFVMDDSLHNLTVPFGITIDSSDNVFVAVGSGFTEFDSAGVLIYQIRANRARGILLDQEEKNVYMTYYHPSQPGIIKYNFDLERYTWYNKVQGLGGLAFDKAYNLYAANRLTANRLTDSIGLYSTTTGEYLGDFATGLSHPYYLAFADDSLQAVPEPGIISLVALGLFLGIGVGRRSTSTH